MGVQWTPMRWPDSWKDPGLLDLLSGTAIDCLLVERREDLGPVRQQAEKAGLHVVDPGSPPNGAAILKGEWPGVKMSRGGGAAQMAGGPTGVPWVDSNGWIIRLNAALHPEKTAWIDAPPAAATRLSPDSYLIAIADSAAHGGRWIVSPAAPLAADLAARKPDALNAWKKIGAATSFFAARKQWSSYPPAGTVGVLSDFIGSNEFFSRELLNLLGRAGQHYLVLPKGAPLADLSSESVRAVIYTDAEPPADALRKRILSFVEAGGLLIATPRWGEAPGKPAKDEDPRYSLRTVGKGTIALARSEPDDPYLWAQDAVLLVSHRYDLVRFWNGGATASHYTISPDRKRAVVHLLFYANRGPDAASVRISGRYRSAKVLTIDRPEVPNVEVERQKDALEIHLPQVSQYVALELES